MKKANNRILFLLPLYILGFLFKQASAQPFSPFNGLEIKDTSSNYSFTISGHFYGASTNASTFPASSILANIDTLNGLKPLFLFCLGDMFMDVNDNIISNYKRSLFGKLKMPLFNSVGNHDVSNNNMYEKVFGSTYYYFNKTTELFIVLNTEINDGSIKDAQFEMLQKALLKANEFQVRNIFIFSHRPVWAEQHPEYSKLFRENTRTALGKNNYVDDIEPLLSKLASEKNVFWISGSMGNGPASFFWDRDKRTNINYMQTAIRDLPRDAVLQVNIVNGNVRFKGISLTGQNIEPIESYSVQYWQKTLPPEQKFNYRLLPLIIFQTVKSKSFLFGIAFSLFVILIVKLVLRWKRKK
jgi:hypothetical protein